MGNYHYLLDAENQSGISARNIRELCPTTFTVMLGLTQKSIAATEDAKLCLMPGFSVLKASSNAKNGLDFQLATHAGFLHATLPAPDTIIIVSGDKGFEAVCEWLRKDNRRAFRISGNVLDQLANTVRTIAFFSALFDITGQIHKRELYQQKCSKVLNLDADTSDLLIDVLEHCGLAELEGQGREWSVRIGTRLPRVSELAH